MSLRDVMAFVQKQQAQAGAAVTPVPRRLSDVGAAAHMGRPGEAANDPSASVPEHLQRCCNVTGNATATASTGRAPNQHGASTGHTPEQPDWRTLDAAYQAHHAHCHVCQAAGRGTRYGLRCGAGASLWSNYTAAITQPGALPWQQPKEQK